MADGIDVVSYLARVGSSQESMIGIVVKVVLLMMVNYALNLAVIGFPAIKIGKVKSRTVVIGLIWLTLLGQIADRLGALLATPLAGELAWILGLRGEGNWFWTLIGQNFLFSGIAVGALAFYFVRMRWCVGTGPSWAIVIAAAIITNPAWAIIYLWL
ncbi:MAG: hypothetical protein WC770_06815 [Phycisphaerae bacterium]|jgi:hypothetical protein